MKRERSFWDGMADTVFFQPRKSETLPVWRDMYRLNRELKQMEHNLYQPPGQETWLGSLKSVIKKAWHEFMDEIKALLTELFFHALKLVLIIVFNVLWFGGIFLILKAWLGG